MANNVTYFHKIKNFFSNYLGFLSTNKTTGSTVYNI